MNHYFARGGHVFVKVEGEAPRQMTTAITPQGRELARFERANKEAECQALIQARKALVSE